MITVAVDTGSLYGSVTGVGRAVTEILDEFRVRSDEIDVIPYVVSRRARLLPGSRRLPYPAAWAMTAWARLDHPRADRHLRPAEIVHGTNYVVPPARIARVVSVYDTWSLRNPTISSPVVRRAMQVLRRNIGSGAVVHASSHATARELRDIFPTARIHVIHLGTPRTRSHAIRAPRTRAHVLESLLGSDAPYLLTVGTVERRKNLPRFIEAFARTSSARSGLRLVIAGGAGDDIDGVQSTIGNLDPRVRPLVHVLGRVSDLDLADLYVHAEAVAYPSLDEGFGFPVLEAMSNGVPVLGSDRGSIPEVAGSAALLVDPLDTDAMGSAIDRLVTDSPLRQSLIAAGFEQCEHFSWDRTAEELLALYRTLVTETNGV